MCHHIGILPVESGEGMNEVGLTLLEGLGSLIPFLHDILMRNVEFVEYKIEHFNIIAIWFSIVIAELIWREFPIADNNQWVLLGVFTCILSPHRKQGTAAEQTGDNKYVDISFHVTIL